MRRSTLALKSQVSAAIVAGTLAGVLLIPSEAHAVGNEQTGTYGKGIVGGGLIGAELVVLVEAAFGVQNPWYYAIGGGLGMVGGGIGGYFLAEATGDTAVPMALLTAGLVGTIPTTIAVLSATQYRPESDAPKTGYFKPPGGLVTYGMTGYSLAFPAVSVRETFSQKEKVTYGLQTATEVRTVLFSAEF